MGRLLPTCCRAGNTLEDILVYSKVQSRTCKQIYMLGYIGTFGIIGHADNIMVEKEKRVSY